MANTNSDETHYSLLEKGLENLALSKTEGGGRWTRRLSMMKRNVSECNVANLAITDSKEGVADKEDVEKGFSRADGKGKRTRRLSTMKGSVSECNVANLAMTVGISEVMVNGDVETAPSKVEDKGKRARRLSTIKGNVPVSNDDSLAMTIDKDGIGEEKEGKKGNKGATNRRFDLRPRKRLSISEDDNVNLYKSDIKRSKSDKSIPTNRSFQLETIFEEPIQNKNGSVKLTGKSKVKRSITFTAFITKTKLKQRNAQIKKYKLKINKARAVRLSLKELELKLGQIRE